MLIKKDMKVLHERSTKLKVKTYRSSNISKLLCILLETSNKTAAVQRKRMFFQNSAERGRIEKGTKPNR